MVVLAHLQVNIEVEGKALTEYDDDETEQPIGSHHATKYIETIAGKPFSIHFQPKGFKIKSANNLRYIVSLDGKKVIDRLTPREGLGINPDVFISKAPFYEEAQWMERDFMFADLQFRKSQNLDSSP